MDEETNIERVENMLYHICGCNPQEAKIILHKCLKRADDKLKRLAKLKNDKSSDYLYEEKGKSL